MAHRSYHSWSYESRDNRTGSIQESEQKRPRKRLSQNFTYYLLILFILLAFSISASVLIISAIPEFETKSNQVDLGDISEGLNGSGVITIDSNVSTVELTLIQQPFHYYDDVQVNISTSSTFPPLSFTTSKENIQISPLTKGRFRTGCNFLSFDEPIYLQRGSLLKYNITSSNHEVINELCYFSNTSDYITFLADYTFKYVSKFCFNISGNAIINITINETSSYYVAIDIGNNNNISLDITVSRSYYDIKRLQDLSSQCSLNESFNFSCIIKICDGYLCDTAKNRYVIVETSHNIVLKYDTLITFHFNPTVRIIFFSCAMFFELIAIAAALKMAYKLCKKSGPQTKPKCTCKGVLIAVMVVLFVMSFHFIAMSLATINTHDWFVNNSTKLVGNTYPVLLNSQGFNKSVSNVEITLPFPSADSVSVYKISCNNLKTSTKKLSPRHVVTNLPKTPGSTITYNITSTLPLNSNSCISLVFMNSVEAYHCLENGKTNVKNFTVKDEQNYYYVGIETNIDINEANTDIITVSAEVFVVQVHYNLSNTEVYTSLSVNKTSFNVRVCETFLCLDRNYVCILVNSTSFDFISYSIHPTITTIRSTSHVFGFLAIVTCAFFLILFIFASFGYCIKKKGAVSRKILSNRKRNILISIFIGIMIFEGVFIPIILSYSIKFYGKTWINNTKDFVLVNLDQTGFIKWVNTHDIAFSVEADSVETDSANSPDISLYTVRNFSEVVPSIFMVNKSKIECKNFHSSCVLNESIYLVKAEGNYVNYNISFSNISRFPFRVSTFDDYEQYENFLAKKLYKPLNQSPLFNGATTFHFNFSNISMKQKAAYYHFVLHPAFQTDVFTQYYYTSSSVQMESNISHYKLNNNHRPHCNITKNSTSICRSSKKDNISVVARANMLTKPVLLVAATTNVPLAVFVAVVPALVVIIFVGLVIVFAFIVRWKSRFKGYKSLSRRSLDDDESAGESESTRQDDSEEQPGSERELAREDQLVRDSHQSDEIATDDELAKKDDEPARKDDQTNKLEGVHVAGEKSFLIQNNLLKWEEYGFRITVPEGAVSPSEINEVSITALVSGEFILPKDSELVSVVYIITFSKPLLKPVLLEIQHCVSIETPSHANYLSFVTSPNDRCPFQFQLVDEGSFPVGERYGKIQISEFSPWAIVKNLFNPYSIQTTVSQSNTSHCEAVICATTPLPLNSTGESANPLTQDEISVFYFAQALYQNESIGRQWLLMFLFGRDLDALKMYMMKEYRSAKRDENFPFRFQSSGRFLEIHTNTEKCGEGWSIMPHITEGSSMENPIKVTKVSQSTIDEYGRMNPPCFPQCHFTITVTPGSNYSNPELIKFQGIDNSTFNTILPMDEELATDDKSVKMHDQIGDVHFAGKKSFLIQNNLPQLLNWEEYGLRITVPEGAVPPSETIEVSITALVGAEFILPEDSELVSAVYTITVSKPLLKPVLLEIQHCVSIETPSHANHLSFVASSNDYCRFEFQTVDKGSFPVGERYGSIYISKFSHLGIIYKKIKGWVRNLRYSHRSITPQAMGSDSSLVQDALPALWYYVALPLYICENKRLGKEWGLVFLFGRGLNAIKMYMKDEFNRSRSDKELFFQFESLDGCIEIYTDTEECSKGWSIRPHQENPTKVSQSIIDIYGQMNPPCFPQCRFTITATPGSNTNPELRHPVTFKGITSDNTVFNIVLTMGDHLIQHSAARGSSLEQSPQKIFRRHFYDFYCLIKPDNISAIALELFAKELITEDSFTACTNDGRPMDQRALSLLNPLRVTTDQPHVLTKLIEVLKDNQAFRSLAEEMESEI